MSTLQRQRTHVPSTLAGRLAATFVGIVLVMLLLLGVLVTIGARRYFEDQLVASLEQQARAVAVMVDAQDLADPNTASAEFVARLAEGLDASLTLIADDGTILADSSGTAGETPNLASQPDVLRVKSDRVIHQVTTLPGSQTQVLTVIAQPEPGGVIVRLSTPLAAIDRDVSQVQKAVAITSLITAFIVGIAGIFVATRINRPLLDLRRQAQRVAAGDLSAEVIPASTRELGDVGRSFNLMTRRLSTTLADLERSQTRLEVTLGNLSDGVVITDTRGNVLRLNNAAADMVNLSMSPLGNPFVEVVRDHEIAEVLRRALDDPTGAISRGSVVHGRSQRRLDLAAQRLKAPDGDLGVLVMHDVTEIHRLESVRREFVANVSHELRTPLASIRAVVETLEDGAIDDPEVRMDFLASIRNEVDRLTQLVNELLDLARLDADQVDLHLELVRPAELVHRAVDRLRPQTQRAVVDLVVDVAPELPSITVDPARIEQVLLNLVHNAIKFTPSGGTITVSARETPDAVRISVSDTGTGVHPDDLPRLFERFYKTDKSRRSEGTGLGLAIAKHIVLAHGGTIWAESEVEKGSTFTFELPRGVAAELSIG